MGNKDEEHAMREDIQTILSEKPEQFLRDVLGAMSIGVTFLGCLYLPGLF